MEFRSGLGVIHGGQSTAGASLISGPVFGWRDLLSSNHGRIDMAVRSPAAGRAADKSAHRRYLSGESMSQLSVQDATLARVELTVGG